MHLNRLISMIYEHPSKHSIQADDLVILKKGHCANAYVYQYHEPKTQQSFVVKDFSHSPAVVRMTFGRFNMGIEYRALMQLRDLKGIQAVTRLGPYTLRYPFIKGYTLWRCREMGEQLPDCFFEQLEQLTHAIHQRGRVHLDLRNLSNILRGEEGQPYVIDFQSSLSTRYYPQTLRKCLEGIDMSGVYKAWAQFGALSTVRAEHLSHYTRIRQYWVFNNRWITAQFHQWRRRFKSVAQSIKSVFKG
ncbi:MAG: serine/threonine protein kinase [Legionellales bacterium]|nr:serine/threonine protein kinase [Legionellales bacterium]